MTPTQILLIVVEVIAIVSAFFLGAYLVRSETRHRIHRLEALASAFQIRQGEHPEEGPYAVATLDGGRNWWTVEIDGDDVRVTGDARKAFPKATAMLRLETRGPGFVPDPKEGTTDRDQPLRVIDEKTAHNPYENYAYNPGDAFGPERGAVVRGKDE